MDRNIWGQRHQQKKTFVFINCSIFKELDVIEDKTLLLTDSESDFHTKKKFDETKDIYDEMTVMKKTFGESDAQD